MGYLGLLLIGSFLMSIIVGIFESFGENGELLFMTLFFGGIGSVIFYALVLA